MEEEVRTAELLVVRHTQREEQTTVDLDSDTEAEHSDMEEEDERENKLWDSPACKRHWAASFHELVLAGTEAAFLPYTCFLQVGHRTRIADNWAPVSG